MTIEIRPYKQGGRRFPQFLASWRGKPLAAWVRDHFDDAEPGDMLVVAFGSGLSERAASVVATVLGDDRKAAKALVEAAELGGPLLLRARGLAIADEIGILCDLRNGGWELASLRLREGLSHATVTAPMGGQGKVDARRGPELLHAEVNAVGKPVPSTGDEALFRQPPKMAYLPQEGYFAWIQSVRTGEASSFEARGSVLEIDPAATAPAP